jgi:zinc transporter 7
MSTASAWYNAYVAILFISTLPNALLLLIPTHLLVGDDGVRSSVLSTAGINYQSLMLSFSAAGLMGDVFIHTLPHLLSSHNNHGSHVHHHGEEEEGEEHSSSTGRTDRNMLISLTLLVGYLTFLTVERLFTCNHSHHDKMHNEDAHVQRTPHNGATTAVVNAVNDSSHGDRSSLVRRSKGDNAQFKAAHKDGPIDNKEPLFEGSKHGTEDGKQSRWPLVEALRNLHVTGWLNLVADSLHNFTDGIAIGASFANGRGLAYATFLSVIIHEIPHELGDFTILLQSGMT